MGLAGGHRRRGDRGRRHLVDRAGSRPRRPPSASYLLATAAVPTAALLESTVSFINWRAFSFTYLAILLVSLVWEVTLAMPYGWWDYQPERMVGIHIRAWWDLPIEAVLVWLAVTYATVVVYEAVKMWQASGDSAQRALVGDAGSRQAKRARLQAAAQRPDGDGGSTRRADVPLP